MQLPQGLPEIRGRWLLAYRLVWAVLMALALFGGTWGVWLLRSEGVRDTQAIYDVGLRWEGGPQGRVNPMGAAAVAAGVVPGSELVAINGRPAGFGHGDGLP